MHDTATTVRIPMKIEGSVVLVTGATHRGPRCRGGLAPGRFGIGSAVNQAVHQIGAVLGVAQYKEGRTL